MDEAVSVIIPSWNRIELTLRAVHSVLLQSYTHFELIVVDDGSTEDYSEVVKLLQITGHKYIRIPHAGVSAARNAGISHAKSPWIAFLDSDDVWHPDKLKLQMEHVFNNPECRVLQTYEQWVRNGVKVHVPERLLPAFGDAFQKSLDLCCISPSAVLLHREVLDKTGTFDEKLVVCEDYDLWLRVTTFYPVHLIEKELVTKYSEPHPQLSRSQIAMDRFRVYALLKYLADPQFPHEKRALASDILLKKLDILYTGALKREKHEDASLYADISERASLLLCDINKGKIHDPGPDLFEKAEILLIDRSVSEA